MYRRIVLCMILFLLAGALCFGQAGALRDYVGIINIKYHADVIAYMGKFRDNFEAKGYPNAAKAIDDYLKGYSGSGFIYVSPDGGSYILTNEHVSARSESLSITFEKLDGSKTTYDRLKVLYVDEDKDLALLVFEDGKNPFAQSLSFHTEMIDEGMDVYAAGFPGIANTAIWQFSRGNISNASVRLPKNSDSDETMGPFIQHTAQVDPGNSGGPLLIAAQDVPTGYAVIGINTLSALRRQAANYAIPVAQIEAFIKAALSTEPVNERELITKKADAFVKGLNSNRTVYDHISGFISNNCTATNAEYAVSELLDRATRTVLLEIDEIFSHDPVEGLNAAVAWLIEDSMRSKSGSLKVSLDSIEPNDKGGFNVNLNVNDVVVTSEWIKEYGVYRMETYGNMVTGDKTVLEQKRQKRIRDKNLRTEPSFSISAGYAYILTYGSGIHAALRIGSPFTFGADMFFGLGGTGYIEVTANAGYAHPIRLGSFGLMPFGEVGAGIIRTNDSKRDTGEWGRTGFGFAIGLTVKGGLMFTTSKVPGLFGRAFYQHSFPLMKDQNESIKHHGTIGISVGYGF